MVAGVRLVTAISLIAACSYSKPDRHVDGGTGEDPDAIEIDAAVIDIDAPDPCVCQGSNLSCPGATTVCTAGCLATPEPHCALLTPSNAVNRDLLLTVSVPLVITAATVFNTDTGAISGGITRAAGNGVSANIGFTVSNNLGVFYMDAIEIAAGITVSVRGSRPAVFLVGKTARITGIIDASSNQLADRFGAGPGGGMGGHGSTAQTGCGPGGDGAGNGGPNNIADAGGGGGGGGLAGGKGGNGAPDAVGGTAGAACVTAAIEPLVGGSGGGLGAKGDAPAKAIGGGGGGALQISALEQIIVSGTIDAGGSGGEGGRGGTNGMNAGGGGGGGSGGAILLEAPVVTINAGSILAANGGGGGGAGDSGSNGANGGDGPRSGSVATGGNGAVALAGDGGNGGASSTAAQAGDPGGDTSSNGGGGGGGVGRIYVRAFMTPTLGGTISPPAGVGTFRSN